MEKNFEQELKELFDKYKAKDELKCNCRCENEMLSLIPPTCTDIGNEWILGLLLILFMNDFPKKEEKEPIINVYLGGDK